MRKGKCTPWSSLYKLAINNSQEATRPNNNCQGLKDVSYVLDHKINFKQETIVTQDKDTGRYNDLFITFKHNYNTKPGKQSRVRVRYVP